MHYDSENKKIAVIALFDDRETMGNAVEGLRANGFRDSDLSALLPDSSSTMEVAHERHSKAPEGAMTGSLVGALAGVVLGALVGFDVLVVNGLERMAESGPILAALAGGGALGAIGWILGLLVGRGRPEYEAKRYQSYLNRGGMLLAVHADDRRWARVAKEVLDSAGGRDIVKTSEAPGKQVQWD